MRTRSIKGYEDVMQGAHSRKRNRCMYFAFINMNTFIPHWDTLNPDEPAS